MQTRQIALAAVLFATLGATWWAARVPDEAAPTPSRPPAIRPGASTAAPAASEARGNIASSTSRDPIAQAPPPRLTVAQYTRAPLAEQPALRVALAWGPPPPPPPPVLPKGYKPPPPPPPPLPFKPIGKLEDGAVVTAFLLGTDRTYAVRAGDTIDSSYHVDEVTPRHVVFTFLPLKARQELRLEGP